MCSLVLPVQPNARQVQSSIAYKRLNQAGALRDAPGVGEPLPGALTVRRCRLVLHPLRLTENRYSLVDGDLDASGPLAFFMKAKSPRDIPLLFFGSPWTSCLCCIT